MSMQCAACGRELVVAGLFPGAVVRCPCGANQAVHVKAAPVSAPSAPRLPRESHGCPRCQAPLAVRDAGGLVVGACEQGHGLFVTHAVLRATREASPAVVEALDSVRAPATGPSDEDALLCPSCGEQMVNRMVGKTGAVHVDICKVHGTWFDAGELRASLTPVPSTTSNPDQTTKANAILDVALALEAARDEETAREAIATADDVLDTFNVFVLGRPSLKRRY